MGRLSAKELLRKQWSAETFEDAVNNLSKYGICNIIRPTGFGKSYILAKITSLRGEDKKYKYKKCLYLYPLDCIREDIERKYGKDGTNKVKLRNTEFMSYAKLNRLRAAGTLLEYIKQFDLIMCDECHLCGSEGFRACHTEFEGLIGKDGIHLIGVTASPDRMDGFDEIGEIFGGARCAVREITQETMYENGILHRPLWYVGVYDKDVFGKSASGHVKEFCAEGISKEEEEELTRKVNKIEGAEKLLKKVIENHRKDSEYLKFIVFYVDKADLLDKREMVMEWFEDVFMDYGFEIHEYNVVSTSFDEETATDTEDTKKGKVRVSKIDEVIRLKERKGHIDIINCINMLNMGYHSDDIDGIIMLRNTRSAIIQIQQVGRCQSITAKRAPIVIDLVNNINTKKWFKGDNNRKEDVLDLTNVKANRNGDYEIKSKEGADVILMSEYLAFMQYSDKLLHKEQYRRTEKVEELKFWYTKLKAPLYVLAIKYKRPVEEIQKILELNGVRVMRENRMYESLTERDKENIRELKKLPGVTDSMIKVYLKGGFTNV